MPTLAAPAPQASSTRSPGRKTLRARTNVIARLNASPESRKFKLLAEQSRPMRAFVECFFSVLGVGVAMRTLAGALDEVRAAFAANHETELAALTLKPRVTLR
jgi:hypothetical protein